MTIQFAVNLKATISTPPDAYDADYERDTHDMYAFKPTIFALNLFQVLFYYILSLKRF